MRDAVSHIFIVVHASHYHDMSNILIAVACVILLGHQSHMSHYVMCNVSMDTRHH